MDKRDVQAEFDRITSKAHETETPIYRQWKRIKAMYPEVLILFRLGDFYEAFDEDAQTFADDADVVLTSRRISKDLRVKMAGVPYHASEGYIARLVAVGHKVGIVEQMGEPIKGLVPRELTRIVKPGEMLGG